jgi:DNA/RNA endonuclease G (NUC1)
MWIRTAKKVNKRHLAGVVAGILLVNTVDASSNEAGQAPSSSWWSWNKEKPGETASQTDINEREARKDKHPQILRTPRSVVEHSLSGISPLSPVRILRPNPHLEIAFDVRNRNPVYVLERMVVTEEKNNKTPKKRHNFYEEMSLPESFRARNQHYHQSGYDRGHMAPAADFGYQDVDGDPVAADTYTLCNIAPQQSDFNRGIWANLEAWTRRVARDASQRRDRTTYVVTGPLWLPRQQVAPQKFLYSYPALGTPPSLVAVPTHFFKVVVVVAADAPGGHHHIHSFACFVLANDEQSNQRTLADALVRWTDLEAVTGLELFPQWVSPDWKKAADVMTTRQILTNTKGQAQGAIATVPLLLTDGSKTTSKNDHKILRQYADLTHLCQGGKCQRS